MNDREKLLRRIERLRIRNRELNQEIKEFEKRVDVLILKFRQPKIWTMWGIRKDLESLKGKP